nr:ISAs1 family transposase [Rosistilla oblonga]
MSRNSGLAAPPCSEHVRQQQLEVHRTVDKGHGRVEIRVIETSNRLVGHVDWPGFAQAIRLTRTRILGGERQTEISYAITSVDRERADARDLLKFVRGHWGIENRLHWVRDVAMGEDKCRARTGAIPQNLAALRNATLTLVRAKGHNAITSTLRRLATKPMEIISILKH